MPIDPASLPSLRDLVLWIAHRAGHRLSTSAVDAKIRYSIWGQALGAGGYLGDEGLLWREAGD